MITKEQALEIDLALEPRWVAGQNALAEMREASIAACIARNNGATAQVHSDDAMTVVPPPCLMDGASHPICRCCCHDPRSIQPFERVTRRMVSDLMSIALLHKCWRDGSGDHSLYVVD